MRALFRTIFFEPLYNLLIWLSAIVPGHDLGIAIILLTILVKFALLPLQHRALTTQKKLKELEAEIAALKAKHQSDSAAQAQAIMALYRAHGVNPFSGFVTLLIQLPIMFALLYVFRDSLTINSQWLYAFITPPLGVNAHFLGLLDLTARSIPLALVAGVSQYFQISLAVPPLPQSSNQDQPSLKADLARSMNMQMRFIFPVMITFVALGFPAAVVLYWVTSNCFAIGHELLVRRRAKILS